MAKIFFTIKFIEVNFIQKVQLLTGNVFLAVKLPAFLDSLINIKSLKRIFVLSTQKYSSTHLQTHIVLTKIINK